MILDTGMEKSPRLASSMPCRHVFWKSHVPGDLAMVSRCLYPRSRSQGYGVSREMNRQFECMGADRVKTFERIKSSNELLRDKLAYMNEY